ncbi:MAG: hypothetical protein KAT01_09315 [Candidatus Aminicenantes bacterium]|nr:hypothetical protein [Candidatus Aminicenantes bacterium]
MFNRHAFSINLLFLLVISLISISTAQDRPRDVKMSKEQAQERKELAEMQNKILRDKFDILLPQIMREHEIDMWIHIVREGDLDPLGYNFGSNEGIFIFTDRGGDRIERAFFGFHSDKVEESSAYDIIIRPEIKIPLEAYPNIRILLDELYRMGGAEWPGGPKTELDFRFNGIGEFVAERDPKRIAVNYLEELGSAIFYEIPRLRPDGISLTDYNLLVKALGNIYAGRIISSEYLIVDYFARPVLSEFDLYKRIRSDIDEKQKKALSSIVRGVTRVNDLGRERSAVDKNGRRQRGDYVIQGGELLILTDGRQSGGFLGHGWKYGNYHEDIDAYAYVLQEGETEPPTHIKRFWNNVMKVRTIIENNVRVGRTAGATFEILKQKLEKAGMINSDIQRYDRSKHPDKIWVSLDMHAAGSGLYAPRIGPLGPDWQRDIKLPMYHHFYFEFFIDMPMPEWGEGRSLRVRFHDGAMATESGVKYFFPYPREISLIR